MLKKIMICLKLNRFFNYLSHKLYEFVFHFLQTLPLMFIGLLEHKVGSRIIPPPAAIPGLVPGFCPLCGKERRGDTVLISSGVVFCYACITKYIRKKHFEMIKSQKFFSEN